MSLHIKAGIDRARKDAGLTLLDLGHECGVTSTTLAKYERGLSSPKLTTLQRVAVACNITTSTLLVYMEEGAE